MYYCTQTQKNTWKTNKLADVARQQPAKSRSMTNERQSTRSRLLVCTYDAPPRGPSVRVDKPTESGRHPPINCKLPLCGWPAAREERLLLRVVDDGRVGARACLEGRRNRHRTSTRGWGTGVKRGRGEGHGGARLEHGERAAAGSPRRASARVGRPRTVRSQTRADRLELIVGRRVGGVLFYNKAATAGGSSSSGQQ